MSVSEATIAERLRTWANALNSAPDFVPDPSMASALVGYAKEMETLAERLEKAGVGGTAELLAALEAITEAVGGRHLARKVQLDSVLPQCRAAIAKARGDV